VLAVSTHDTDWLLVGADRAAEAERVWVAAGFRISDGVARS
jgi:hypothetical protein